MQDEKAEVDFDDSHLPPCQYGENCYRKNPVHFREFSHPHLRKLNKAKPLEEKNSQAIQDIVDDPSLTEEEKQWLIKVRIPSFLHLGFGPLHQLSQKIKERKIKTVSRPFC